MNQDSHDRVEILTEIKSNDKINQSTSSLQNISQSDKYGFQHNEDICFKCKKAGEIYCCDNCFRSYHWKCIDEIKIRELTESSYVINFICEFCDQQNNCIKCNSLRPKQNFNLLDFSEDRSIFTTYKCTHCYSKIHKKCLDIPLQILNKKLAEKQNHIQKQSQLDIFQHYVCSKCLENVGITQIISTQRICNNLGIQNLYYYVLLNTNSPIHKGWVEEYVLRNHLKKFSGNQTFVSEFLKNKQLYLAPQIQKILAIRFPAKYKKASIGDVQKIIQERSKLSITERYGDPDNFKFLVKWKQRDYTNLTWQDQTIVNKKQVILRNYLSQKQNQCLLIDSIKSIEPKLTRGKGTTNPTNYKLIEYYLNNDQKVTSKMLEQKNSPKDSQSNQQKSQFAQKMISLDQKNQKGFLQILQFENNQKHLQEDYRKLIVKYLNKLYCQQIILRPTLIISDNLILWQQSLKNSSNQQGTFGFKYVKFQGSKLNTDFIKNWEFFITNDPSLFKFQILLIDYNYFLYENKYLFQNIPSFYATVFDQSQKLPSLNQKIKFIQKTYLPFKSKVYKEILIVQNSLNHSEKESFINNLLSLNHSAKNPIKKCIYHNILFTKIKECFHTESNLKSKVEKRHKEISNVLIDGSKQILNQGQRLSFLKFIMAFGLNIKKIDDICNRMLAQNPGIWQSLQREKMIETIKKYLSLFMAIISNNSIQNTHKKHENHTNYFLFNFQRESVLKRIIQLKKLKTQVEKSFDDHSKFIVKKPFMFFSSGQCKPFPLWNNYQDYTLGALIVEEGYEMWDNVIKSKKWIDYHSQLQTRKIYQLDAKTGTFSVQQKIVPIKKKINSNSLLKFQQRIIQHMNHKIVDQSKEEKSRSQETESGKQQIPQTYGEYLLKKIRSSKQFKQFQYARLDDIKILQGHIAQRGDSILLSLTQQ